MNTSILHTATTSFIAIVWLLNGLYCKVLGGTPRHEQIISEILGIEYAHTMTLLIGVSEIIMAIWIWSRFKSRFNAYVQMTIVALMNTLEFFLVPDLLLWGRANALFAIGFIFLIYIHEFHLKPVKR